MERRYNIYSNIWRYLQIIEDIIKWIKDIFKSFKNIPIFDKAMKFNIFYELQNS